jgi:hypothetical protein
LAASVPASGSDHLAARQRPQPLIALPVAAGVRDQLGHERVGDRQRHRDGGARVRDRLDGEHVADVIASGAAPLFRNGHAEQPVLPGRVHDVGRKFAGLIDSGCAQRYDVAREGLDFLLEGFLFGGELEQHRQITTVKTIDTKDYCRSDLASR